MNIHDATETAYKNGYKVGYEKGKRDTVKHGHWIGEGDGYADGEIVLDVWYCSECGYCIDDGTDEEAMLPNFCPNCGADMRQTREV